MATRGARRHLVTLWGPGALVPDGEGGFTQTPAMLTPPTRYAEIKPATARDLERTTAGTVIASASHIVTMDYHAGVTIQTQLTWTTLGGKTHTANVTGVSNPEERSVDLVLTCEEVVT